MLAFIDESGDTGFKFETNSSNYFTISVVYFEQESEAHECSNRIDLLKQDLRLTNKEFKFASMKRLGRETFLKAMIPYSFYYLGVIIDKQRLVQGVEYYAQAGFYKYAASLIFELATPYLHKAIVVIDGQGSRELRAEMKKYMKVKSKLVVSNIKFQDSHRNNLLQLADMVTGALARTRADKSDKDIYRSIIKSKEIALKIYPPEI